MIESMLVEVYFLRLSWLRPDNRCDAMKGHAEIAGGGIGGLSCAVMLARRGWTVRVHERAPEIREGGTGIYLKNNATEVLEELEIFDRLLLHGCQLQRAQRLDRNGRIMQDRALVGQSRVHAFVRQSLIEVLRDAAEQAGVEITTKSPAIAADPDGQLLLEDGRRHRADLVVVADGARSKVRESLGIGASYQSLPTVVNRYLISSREITPELIMKEYWSGRYRIGITPCGQDLTYVYQVCPEWDNAAAALPNNVAFWSRAFPRLRREIEITSQTYAIQHNYSVVRCPQWQKGRVAIIGDAAHGLPPALGQGIGLILMNARALAAILDCSRAVEAALPAWEAAVRFIADNSQRWALRYDFFTRQWPAPLWFMRPAIIWAFRSIPALNKRMRLADQGLKLIAMKSPAHFGKSNSFQQT
jgi:2-polyprenyl-6-methoxyphenol hydroxylase-like FAD-dependent oxidoreductase